MSALKILAIALLLMVALYTGVAAAAYGESRDRRELRKLRVFVVLLCVLAWLGLTGCATRAPNVPKQVTVVVEKFKPLPAWATDPLAKPEPADGTVGARLRSHEARGAVIDVANCHRLLLKKLDAGAAVDPKECAQP